MARRGYPPEFRRRVVDLVEGGRKVSEVAAELEVSELRRANAADCVSSGMDASAGCAALRSRPESP